MNVSYLWLASLIGPAVIGPDEMSACLRLAGWRTQRRDPCPHSASLSSGGPQDDVVWRLEPPVGWPLPLSHLGVAREVAAITGTTFTPPPTDAPMLVDKRAMEGLVSARVDGLPPEAWIGGVALSDVGRPSSPVWLQRRLCDLGIETTGAFRDSIRLTELEFGLPVAIVDLDSIEGELRLVEPLHRSGGVGAAADLPDDDLRTAVEGDWRGRMSSPVQVHDSAGIVCQDRGRVSPRCAFREQTVNALLLMCFSPWTASRPDPQAVRSQALGALMQVASTASWVAGARAMSGMLFETHSPWSPSQVSLETGCPESSGATGGRLADIKEVFDTLGLTTSAIRAGLAVELRYSSADNCSADCLMDHVDRILRARSART